MGGGGERREPIFRDIRRYFCDYCGICRSKKALVSAHMLSHHKEEMEGQRVHNDKEKEGEKSNTCEECGASFKKPAYLKQHMQSHSLERPFTCPVDDCQSSCRRKDHLTRHLLQHQGKLFTCPVENCNRRFAFQGNMKRHVKEFHDEESPPNDVCSKEYVCPEVGCGKVFKFASKLQKHEDSHAKLDSVEAVCSEPGCFKHFTNEQCLKAHIQSCHQHIICETCGTKQLKKNIKRHLRMHESGCTSERVKCHFTGCVHTFSTKSNLDQHVKAVHLKLRPFVCGIPGCGMRFPFKHVRDNHEKTGCHVYTHVSFVLPYFEATVEDEFVLLFGEALEPTVGKTSDFVIKIVQGDFEELDEQFRLRLRGGRKRESPPIEALLRKRVTPPSQSDSVLCQGSEYLSWLLSSDAEDQQ